MPGIPPSNYYGLLLWSNYYGFEIDYFREPQHCSKNCFKEFACDLKEEQVYLRNHGLLYFY